jgi:hypothetical protein
MGIEPWHGDEEGGWTAITEAIRKPKRHVCGLFWKGKLHQMVIPKISNVLLEAQFSRRDRDAAAFNQSDFLAQ